MSLAAELDIPESGAVFTFGKSHFADNEPSHFFIKNDPVVDIACGDDHTAVICEQGRVFAFGSNNHGQLGLGHMDNVQRPACLKWLKPRKARQVVCGRSHSVILTDKNQLYACGDNSEGQLGIGCLESQCVPQIVEIESEENPLVNQIAAGAEHTIVLLDNGNAYACGSNSEGQLGLGEGVKNSPSLVKIPLDKEIKFIGCGYYHTVLITRDGEAYIFGDNENQRLGVSDAASHIRIPRLVSISVPLKSAHCGHYHTFFMSDSGMVYAVGSNEQGQLGLPRSVIEVNQPTDISTDKLFEGHSIRKIACGATHTAFITENGYLYTCGDSTHQKLCLEEDSDVSNNNLNIGSSSNQYLPKRVRILEGFIISKVACGGCHTILTATKDGTVNNNADSRAMPVISELPPLQKVPASIMNRSTVPPDEEKPPEPPEDGSGPQPNVEKSDLTNGNVTEPNDEDKRSIDSLEPNVSGSHIIEINELSTSALPDIESEAQNMNEQILIIEQELESSEPIKIETMVTNGITQIEDSMEAVVIEAISPVKNMLKVPEPAQQSPDMSTKSDISQKTIKSSNGSQDSENETIICNSEKSSPQMTKVTQKTQAVIPILRSDDAVTVIENKIMDESDVIHSKLEKGIENEGKISKFFSGLRNESCIGKSRVISNVDIKEQVSAEEVTTAPLPVANQTNSRTCIII